jgi:hypothetical protein
MCQNENNIKLKGPKVDFSLDFTTKFLQIVTLSLLAIKYIYIYIYTNMSDLKFKNS